MGLLFVAWRPSLAGGLLPVVAAFVVCAAGATFVDVIAGRASMTDELVHVPVMAGLVLLALLLAPRRRSRGLASI